MLLRVFCRADARAAAQVALLSRPDRGNQTMLFETSEGGKSRNPLAPRRTNLGL
jgi:hypothetical protein